MWTADNRPRYNRDKLRYPSDLTDAEWAHIEPLIPPGKPGGGKRRVAIREVINGVMYILSTGCQWRAPLPKDRIHHAFQVPPRSTVHDYLGRHVELGTARWIASIVHAVSILKCREKAARASLAQPLPPWPRTGRTSTATRSQARVHSIMLRKLCNPT